jgi:hypothetical protein
VDVLERCTGKAIAKKRLKEIQERGPFLVMQKDVDSLEFVHNSVVETFPRAKETKLEPVVM